LVLADQTEARALFHKEQGNYWAASPAQSVPVLLLHRDQYVAVLAMVQDHETPACRERDRGTVG
jgi:hypothetical protein